VDSTLASDCIGWLHWNYSVLHWWIILLQWHFPNGVLPCRWYVTKEHDHWPSSKLSGYRRLLTVHWHQSPSARWYMRAPSRSPPVSWWLKRCTYSSVMILPGILTCHVAKEAESSCFNDTWNWRVAGSLLYRSVGNVLSIRDPKDFSERPRVKGIQSPSTSLCDTPRFQSIRQHREDIGLIQPDRYVDPDTGPTNDITINC